MGEGERSLHVGRDDKLGEVEMAEEISPCAMLSRDDKLGEVEMIGRRGGW